MVVREGIIVPVIICLYNTLGRVDDVQMCIDSRRLAQPTLDQLSPLGWQLGEKRPSKAGGSLVIDCADSFTKAKMKCHQFLTWRFFQQADKAAWEHEEPLPSPITAM